MYYVINDLDIDDEDDAPHLEIHEELLTNPRRGWHSGERLADPPTEILRIEATPHLGYAGPPPDYYDDAVSLMSPRLADVLRRAGVDNLDLFPAVITYRGSGLRFDWWAFNLVGLGSAASLAAGAQSLPLMFRLQEYVMTTLVHASVRRAIEEAGIDTLTFVDPEDWIVI